MPFAASLIVLLVLAADPRLESATVEVDVTTYRVAAGGLRRG